METRPAYSPDAPERSVVETWPGPLLLEFGAPWCGHCQAAQKPLGEALAGWPGRARLTHLKIEDGPGRPLGRSFRVKLWPTLILMENGVELARLVRPTQRSEIEAFLRVLPGA